MKAFDGTHFENENMFLEKWNEINPFSFKLQFAKPRKTSATHTLSLLEALHFLLHTYLLLSLSIL